MKKTLFLMAAVVLALTLCACASSRQEQAKDRWDCTVTCAKTSAANSYIITYSEEDVISRTGVLTLHHQTPFPVTVHLLSAGNQELTCEIDTGGNTAFLDVEQETSYTIGIHADVEEGTEIQLMVYDGRNTQIA